MAAEAAYNSSSSIKDATRDAEKLATRNRTVARQAAQAEGAVALARSLGSTSESPCKEQMAKAAEAAYKAGFEMKDLAKQCASEISTKLK